MVYKLLYKSISVFLFAATVLYSGNDIVSVKGKAGKGD